MRKGIFLGFLLAVLLAPLGLLAQITANPASGCAPLSGVQFTGPSGASNITWDFGNGASSNLANPSATFNSPGNFTVTYNATVNGSPVSYSTQVQVYASPTALFRATNDTVGCAPLPVNFQDQSTSPGGAPITQWEWAFGDGSTSLVGPTTSHPYTLAGRFSVTLKVTDSNGCVATSTRTNQVTASTPPTVVVANAPTSLNSCTAPFTVAFSAGNSTSNSPTGTALTYAWNFGNGTTSTLVTPPAVTYTSTGTYTVTLVVSDNLGCKTTVTKTVLVDRPVASFYAQGAVDDTVCTFVKFINQTLGASISYQYGDGFAGTADTHTYQIPGTYQVTMFAFAGGCADDTTITIHVTQPHADFSILPAFTCDTFITLQLTSLSTGASSFNWRIESIIQNVSGTGSPYTHTFNLRDTTQYVLYDDSIFFKITLTARNSAGCFDTITKTVGKLFPLSARFMVDTLEGCAPLTVVFSDSSRSRPPTLTSYTWDFGDGSPIVTGTNPQPTHTYNTPGVYEAKLVVVNSLGCRDTSVIRKIYVREAPDANFSFDATVLCVGDTLHFTDLTPALDSTETWNYYVNGIPLQNHCPNDPNASWVVNLQAGTYPLSLETGRGQCYGSRSFSNALQVKGPSGSFEFDSDCQDRTIVTFNAILNNVDSLVWNFGDGTFINTTTNTSPIHNYAQAGNYTVSLTMFNSADGCAPQVYTQVVKIRQLSITLPPDYKVCVGDSFNYRALTPVDVFATCSRGYLWDFEPSSPLLNTSTPSVKYAFSQSGTNPIALYVRDENECWDTVRTTVRVYGINAAFTVSDTVGCLPLAATFTDNTIADTTVASWFWWFGDLGTSTAQNPTHTYNNPPFGSSTYGVFMVAQDLFGCFDTAYVNIRPSIPVSTFNVVGTRFICTGDSLRLLASVATHATYTWNFGDGTTPVTGSAFDVVHYYNTPGTFNVTLSVVDSVGCPGTQTINQLVVVQGYPVAGFTSSGDTSSTLCYPIQLNFTDTTQNGTLTRYWNLGTGSPVQPTPTVGRLFDQPGTYDVSLIVQTSFGCRDTVKRTFNVEGPKGDFTISKNAICKGDSILFTIFDTSDVSYYTWNFGDGTDTNQVSPIMHTYNFHPPSGQTVANLVMWSTDSACSASAQKPVTIHRVIADFERNDETSVVDTAHCLGTIDAFTNNSIGADQWNWNFGNGQNFSGENPSSVYYENAGVYTISLAVRDQTLGCIDTIRKTIEVFPRPIVTALGGAICEDATLELASTLTSNIPATYTWSPSVTLSDSTIANPIATPTITTTYQVVVTDTNNCLDTATAVVSVFNKPPSIDWDTLIVIGQEVTLDVSLGTGYSYVWTPTEGLSCANCGVVVAQPLVDTDYTVVISDSGGCFSIPSYYRFEVKPETTIDVPTAFTPNADGSNDFIFVRGWGIKSLIEFKIYNRWGQLVFETSDIKQGWDGQFNGKPQNNDTYTYHAVVETWLVVNGANTIKEKTGAFNLVR